jgi:hypothetical protein
MGVPREVDEMIRAALDEMVPADKHRLVRPTWTCEVDGKPWPCTVKRHALLVEYRDEPTMLTIHFAGYLDLACRDLAHITAGAVWQQLVGWIPRPARS